MRYSNSVNLKHIKEKHNGIRVNLCRDKRDIDLIKYSPALRLSGKHNTDRHLRAQG